MKLDSSGFSDFLKAFDALPEDEKKDALALADAECANMKFVPNPGPQTEAYFSEADEMFFGGAAGPGKTALLCGLPVNEHSAIHLFRREAMQTRGLIEELTKILGTTDGLNTQSGVWRLDDGRTIEISGVKDEKDKEKWQGRAADFKGFDEITHFTRSQYRFIIGWNRSTKPGQRCRVVATGNPPMTADGLWVIQHWAAWLDETHPDPALPGELRWPVRRDDDTNEHEIFFRTKDAAMAHLATLRTAPRDYDGNLIAPRSRTFISAKLEDNPDLMRAGYSAVIESMPAEVRDAMKGNWSGALTDQMAQLIPTSWITAAQERWRPEGAREYSMSAMAFDPAGGGRDSAVLAWRHGGWYAPLVEEQGKQTADGSWSAALIIRHRRDAAPVVVDAGGGAGHGFGGTTLMRLADNEVALRPFNGANESHGKTIDGHLRFANKRAEAYWRFREALDPDQPGGSPISLPPDPELRSDLAAPTFEVTARGILVEDKKKIRARIGRSPGRGDAVVMCYSEGNAAIRRQLGRAATQNLPTMANLGGRQLHGSRASRKSKSEVYSASSSYRDEQG